MAEATIKAQRQTVQIGDIPLEIAMLPDGSYRLSQTQVTAVIEKHHSSFADFSRSKSFKLWLGNDPGLRNFTTLLGIDGSNLPIASISFETALVYWFKWAEKGNSLARALVIALAKHSLYDRADEAFGVKDRRVERDRTLTEDLSDVGITRIEEMYRTECAELPEVQPETQTERELKLKIQLAQLELEKEKIRHDNSSKNPFPATEINKVGASPWQVIPWMQKTLGWANSEDASRLLYRLGYGYRTEHWFKLRILGELWVMPPDSFDSLKTAVEQFKSERN
ncbi:hypothetical protein C7B80_32375 [Cyanosarcina cf. burmensis CCALA 770]|nr:hypothetical protein C7B80_32375 [Cyanosarcina cf. burmensis CCALA 770]